MPLDAGLVVGALGGIVKTGIGLSNYSSASNDLKSAVRPNYPIPKEWFDNDNIAANQAQTGLTSEAKNYYTTTTGRGLQSGIDATLQAGGNVNNIAQLYDQYDTGVNKIASEDSMLKNQNIQNFMNANGNLANERDKAWTLNEYQPYEDRVKADNQKMASGQQTAFNGVSDVTNSLAAFNTSKLYQEGQAGSIRPDAITGGSTPVNIPGASFSAPANPFNTPGGMSVVNNMATSNPNSPYIQSLLNELNNRKIPAN